MRQVVPEHKCKGKWVARVDAGWTAKGTRRRPSRVAPTEAKAKVALKELRRALLAGEEVSGRKVTVKAWCEEWLKMYATRVTPKALQTDTSIVNKWILPNVGHRRLADLTPRDVRKVTDAIRSAGRASTTAGYAQEVLGRALRAAIQEGHQVPQRVLLVPKPAPEAHDREAVPIPDLVALLGVASEREDGARWVAALLQGMRQGECLGLTWEMVDFDGGWIDVSWQLQTLKYADRAKETFIVPDGHEARRLERAWHLVRPKGKSRRVIPMLEWMHEPLAEWRKVAPASKHGLVWPRQDGRPRNSKADRDEWRALQVEAKVAHPSGRAYMGHEARNTTASLLLAAGVDPTITQAILGHSSYAVSQGYMTVDAAMLRRALEGAYGVLTAG